VMTGAGGTDGGGGGGGGAATVTSMVFRTSMPFWLNTSTVIVSLPWLAPAARPDIRSRSSFETGTKRTAFAMTVDSKSEPAATPADGPSIHVIRARKLLIGGAIG